MVKMSKRVKAIKENLETNSVFSLTEVLPLVKTHANAKFDESVDVSICLGVDPRKSDQNVRGAVVMPQGLGKQVRIAAFVQEDQVEAAKEAGAMTAGLEDLAETMRAGELAYDVVIATPKTMRVVGGLGQMLGPRGLMPNAKDGTLADDFERAISEAKKGQVRYRTDKGGVIHASVGKASFTTGALEENIKALLASLRKAKPSSAKGVYLKNLHISSTMGPALRVELAEL